MMRELFDALNEFGLHEAAESLLEAWMWDKKAPYRFAVGVLRGQTDLREIASKLPGSMKSAYLRLVKALEIVRDGEEAI